jgi:hypothetical protein
MKKDVQAGLSNWIVNITRTGQLLKKTCTEMRAVLPDVAAHAGEMKA